MGSTVQAKQKARGSARRPRAEGTARGRPVGAGSVLTRVMRKVLPDFEGPCSLLEKWAVASVMTPEQICRRLGFNPATRKGRRVIARVEELRARYDDVDATALDLDEPLVYVRFVHKDKAGRKKR